MKMYRRTMWAMLCLGLLGFAMPASAAPITLTPDPTHGDSFGLQDLATSPMSSFPGLSTLLVSSVTGTPNGNAKSAIQFNLVGSGVTSANFGTATLTLFEAGGAGSFGGADPSIAFPIQQDILAINSVWDAATLTWNTLPTTTGGPIATQIQNSIGSTLTFDVTALVKQWLNGSLSNNGLMVEEDAVVRNGVGSAVLGIYDSSRAGTSFAPQLTISTVPEPSSIMLGWMGIGGVVVAMLIGRPRRGAVAKSPAA